MSVNQTPAVEGALAIQRQLHRRHHRLGFFPGNALKMVSRWGDNSLLRRPVVAALLRRRRPLLQTIEELLVEILHLDGRPPPKLSLDLPARIFAAVVGLGGCDPVC